MLRYIRKYSFLYILLALSLFQVSYCQDFKNDEERRKYAEKLFQDEKYVEASQHFLHFLSLDQTNAELNFKYGACLIFSDADKTKSLKYLQYAVKSPSIDVLAHYFLGKAYQMSFRFTSAINEFETYKVLASERDVQKYNIPYEIRSCSNAKELMKNFSEIIVLSKKESVFDKIHYSYDIGTNIGGKLLVTEEFQSKIDKKKNFKPIVYFPADPKAPLFFASYGEIEGTGLDLYIVDRTNGLSTPVKLPDNINTVLDDNYGFLQADGKSFYFSSKGHNSMGGYDVFKCQYNSSSKSFTKPVNVDFKVNTPADDILYIVDNKGEFAFFSSNRASKGGYYDVYNIRNQLIPFTNLYVVGTFKNEVGNNLSVTIKVEDNRGNIVGVYNSQSATGAYTIKVPKAGLYSYFVELEGNTKVYAANVDIPIGSALMLKQELVLKEIDGDEILVIRNLFDEEVDNSEDLLANMFLNISDLEENADLFDKTALEEENTDDMFNQMGVDLTNATGQELLGIVDEIVGKIKASADKKEALIKKAYEVADEKSQEAEEQRNLSDEYLRKADEEGDPVKRKSYQELANEARIKAKIASQQAYLAIDYAKEVEKSLETTNANVEKVNQIASNVKKDVQQNNSEKAKDELRNLQVVAKNTEDESSKVKDISEVIQKDVEDKQLDLETLENKLDKAQKNENDIKQEITDLEKRKAEAKKSQQELIQLQIDEANEVLTTNQKKVKEYKEDVDFAKKQIELMELQKNQLQYKFEDVDPSTTKEYTDEEQQQIAERTEKLINETKDVVVDEIPEDVKKETPKSTSILASTRYIKLKEDFKETEKITDSNKKIQAQKSVNETFLKTIDQDIKDIQSKIAQTQGDDKKQLEKNLKELNQLKDEKQVEIKRLNNQLLASTEKQLNNQVSNEQYKSLDSEYKQVANNESPNTQTVNKLKELNQTYISTIEKDIEALNTKANSSQSEIEIAAIKQKVNELTNNKNQKVSEQKELENIASFIEKLSDEKAVQNEQKIKQAPTNSEFELNNKIDLITQSLKEVDAEIFLINNKKNEIKSQASKSLLDKKIEELNSYKSQFESELVNVNEQLLNVAQTPRENKSEEVVNEAVYNKLNQEIQNTESIALEEEKTVKKYELTKQYISVIDNDLAKLKTRAENEQDPSIKQDLNNKAKELLELKNNKIEEKKVLEQNKYVLVTNTIKKADEEYETFNSKLEQTNTISDPVDKNKAQLNINKSWAKTIEDEKTVLKKELSLTASETERAFIQKRLNELEKQDDERELAIKQNEKELAVQTALNTIEDVKGDKKYQEKIFEINKIEQTNFSDQEEKIKAKNQLQKQLISEIEKDVSTLEKSLSVIEDTKTREEIIKESERLEAKIEDLKKDISELERVLASNVTPVDKNVASNQKSNNTNNSEENKTTNNTSNKTEEKFSSTNVNNNENNSEQNLIENKNNVEVETNNNTKTQNLKSEEKTQEKELNSNNSSNNSNQNTQKLVYENNEAKQLNEKLTSLSEKVIELKIEETQLKQKAEQEGAESKSAKEYDKVKQERITLENELINKTKEINLKEMEQVTAQIKTTKQALIEQGASDEEIESIEQVEKSAEKMFAHAKNLRFQSTISPTEEVANIKLTNASKEEEEAIQKMKQANKQYQALAQETGIDTDKVKMGEKISNQKTDAVFIAQNTQFRSDKAKESIVESQEIINEINSIDNQINELEKIEQPTKKQQSEINKLTEQKTEKEIELSKEIAKASEIELKANKEDTQIIKNDLNSFEVSSELKQYQTETEKEESAIERLLQEAEQLEKQAEITKDLDEKRELYKQANVKRSIAVLKQNDVIDSYNKILVDNLIIQKEEAIINDNHNLSSQQFDKSQELKEEAQELYQKASKIKDSLVSEGVREQEANYVYNQLKKQADVKTQLSDLVQSNAQELRELEEESINQKAVVQQMNETEIDELRTQPLYKNHYEVSKEKEQLEKQKDILVIELAKEELRQQSLINKGEQYEFESNVASNPNIKSELLQKAGDTKEQAQISENKINDLEKKIEELNKKIQKDENQLEINLSRVTEKQKEQIQAVYTKAKENTPLEKSVLANNTTANKTDNSENNTTVTETTKTTEQNKITNDTKTNVNTTTNKAEQVDNKIDNINKQNFANTTTKTVSITEARNIETPTKVETPIFVKTDSKTAVYNAKSPIPMNTTPVTGLVYRVQIGAFNKPVSSDVFKGFAPISGETIEGSKLVRYMAGYFSQFTNADNAKKDIRQIPGYSDAFVVAFYNGKRISISEARNLELNGVQTNQLADNQLNIPENNTQTTDYSTENNTTNNTTTTNNNNSANSTEETNVTTTERTYNNPEIITKEEQITYRIEEEVDTNQAINFNKLQALEDKTFRIERVVEQYKGGVLVRLAFKNGSPTNRTLLVDKIPKGFKAEALTLAGAQFAFIDNQVVFQWDATAIDNAEITYALYPDKTVTKEEYVITGVFVTANEDEISIRPDGYFQYKTLPSEEVATNKTSKEKSTPEDVKLDPVKATYYQDVKGAAPASQVEMIKGLFFTVQVGVYSKPVPASALFNLSPLNTELIKTGQIRYTTGIFKTVESASARKDEIRLIGVSDAFVTAYYNGERITITRAKELLQEYGETILAK